jgi:antitoxin ParD1/3/4
MTETGPSTPPRSETPADESCDWRPRSEIAHNIAQAASLKAQAEKGGLVFEAYLPPSQAVWLLSLIEQRKFADPADALINLLGEAQDLAPHEDLRKELLKRTLDAALMPGEPVPIEACVPDMRSRMDGPQPEPAVWREWPGDQPEAEDTSG